MACFAKAKIVMLAAGLCLAATVAGAQNVPPSPTPPHVDNKACNPQEQVTVNRGPNGQQQLTTPSTNGSGASDNLSDKLARTNGVLCPPPNTDPDIRAPAPGGGMTPVIPPPGSPGGNPNAQPK